MLSRIRNIFKVKSPCCGHYMKNVLDMKYDKLVYECSNCKKEWI